MNKKMSKRQRDLKSKLMAAICMLLVSSIMMVSTTYAWFTLSTAPEVTGITTAVGANGNLEMALLPANGGHVGSNEDYGITSAEGDSMAKQDATLANVTWGNLVDLGALSGSQNAYGLDQISLYPAAMNMQDDKLDTGIFLKTPVYGADGRVADLTANTVTGIYKNTKFEQSVVVDGETISDPTGVRAIGTVSSMTDQQIDFRAATSLASSKNLQAQGSVEDALEVNGAALAEIAIAHYKGNGSEKYSTAQLNALKAMTAALLAKDTGTIALLEDTIAQYIWAYTIATNADYESQRETILEAEDLTTLIGTVVQTDSVYAAMINKLLVGDSSIKAKATTANTELGKLSDGASWTEVSACLAYLANTENITINGKTIDELTMGDMLGALREGLNVILPSGSGVFADVADISGNYGATIQVDPGVYDASMAGEYIDATMQTATTVTNGGYVEQAKADLANRTPQGSDNTSSEALSEYYGYIIDLAFRTNASNSYLRLQSAAADRLYTDDENKGQHEETMGGGSTMTFQGHGNFQDANVINLMKSIRLVFFKPADGTILAYGILDASTIKYNNGVTMNLHLASDKDGANPIDDDKIMELNQNQAERLSVLVYLDGESVKNADVAYNVEKSMSGSINLQFSSSATLVPMEYTNLASINGTNNGGNGGNTRPELPEGAESMGNVTVNNTAATAYFLNNTVYVYVPDYVSGATVAVDGTNIENPTVTQNVLALTIADATKDTAVAITITPPAATEYEVTNSLPTDVTSDGQAKATAGSAYTFNLTNPTATRYTVSYTVEGGEGGTLGTLPAKTAGAEGAEDVSGTLECTIPADKVIGNITITCTEA